MNLVLTHIWPVDLPAPFIEYTAEPVYQNLVSPEESPIIFRRLRFDKSYPKVRVEWRFSAEQFETFENFFENDLGNGTACFQMDLSYPTSIPQNWMVRFADGEYEAEALDVSTWQVRSELLLISTYG